MHHLEGERFGRLIATSRTRCGDKSGWLCICDCGNTTTAATKLLTSGHKKSCGCLRKDAATRAAKFNVTHGKSGSRAFRIWAGMLHRCRHPVKNYGARGISVCERWQSFENFIADMGEPPKGMEIDRVDNDGNYEPGNCRWVTPRDNAKNRRNTRLLTHNGTTRCITEWAADLGISHQALHRRIKVLRWPLDRALTERRAS